MPVDKFGRMSDTKTKDTGVSLTYINNNYVRSDGGTPVSGSIGDLLVSKEGVFIKANGHYRATAPLDIDNQKMENLPDPVDEKDAVNKKYIDGIVEALTLKQGLVRENGGFNLVDSYINMNFNRVRNIPYPHHNEDAVPRSFVDNVVDSLKKNNYKNNGRYVDTIRKNDR